MKLHSKVNQCLCVFLALVMCVGMFSTTLAVDSGKLDRASLENLLIEELDARGKNTDDMDLDMYVISRGYESVDALLSELNAYPESHADILGVLMNQTPDVIELLKALETALNETPVDVDWCTKLIEAVNKEEPELNIEAMGNGLPYDIVRNDLYLFQFLPKAQVADQPYTFEPYYDKVNKRVGLLYEREDDTRRDIVVFSDGVYRWKEVFPPPTNQFQIEWEKLDYTVTADNYIEELPVDEYCIYNGDDDPETVRGTKYGYYDGAFHSSKYFKQEIGHSYFKNATIRGFGCYNSLGGSSAEPFYMVDLGGEQSCALRINGDDELEVTYLKDTPDELPDYLWGDRMGYQERCYVKEQQDGSYKYVEASFENTVPLRKEFLSQSQYAEKACVFVDDVVIYDGEGYCEEQFWDDSCECCAAWGV